MLEQCSKTLWKIAGALFYVCLAGYAVAAVVGLWQTADGVYVGNGWPMWALTASVVGMCLAGLCVGLAHLAEWHARRPKPWVKPPGYNDAVLKYFHTGPEFRPRDEFSRAFHDRARGRR